MPPPPPLRWTSTPLVVASASTPQTLHVPEDARLYLQSLRAPSVRVLGLLGPSHTGKRLLLQTLLHADAADFAVHGEDRVLLWLWTPADATHADADTDADADAPARLVVSLGVPLQDGDAADRRRAVALLLLLSSTLLYNDDGEIDDAALARLAWLRDVASSLRIKPNQDDDAVAADFHAHAPSLVWVQRNSKIKWLTDAETGDKLTATQYVEKCLAEENGFSDAVAARNEQRMYVHSLFTRREGVSLSRAVEGASPESLVDRPRGELRAQFVEAVEKQLFAPFLAPRASHLPPKSLMGRELRADQFVHVVDAYVAAINGNALPAIQTASNALLQKEAQRAFDEARATYEQALRDAGVEGDEAVVDGDDETGRPVEQRVLVAAHWRGLHRAMVGLQALQAQLPEQTKKTLYADGLATLRGEFAARRETLVDKNDKQSALLCDQLLKQLLPANLEHIARELDTRPRDSFSDGLVALLTQYKSDLRDAVDKYKGQAAGPALYSSLVDALLASVFESIRTYGASVLRQYQQHMREFQEQRLHVEQEVEIAKAQDSSATFSTEDHKRLYEEQLEQSTQQLTELRRVLLGELNGKKMELDRIMSDMSTMDAKHDVRVKNMESDLAWVRSRTAEMEKAALTERQRLEEDVSGATEEMLVKERTFHQEERSLLAQQKELLARVVELERELVQKKTKHVQQVFVIEGELAKRVDELKQEQAEFARQLKSQAKTDTGVLKLAYQKKKAVVQNDIDRVAREIKEYEEKLKALEMVVSPRAKSASAPTITAAAVKPEGTNVNVVAALRTSSREFLFKSPDVVESPKAVTRLARSDTEMCKAQ